MTCGAVYLPSIVGETKKVGAVAVKKPVGAKTTNVHNFCLLLKTERFRLHYSLDSEDVGKFKIKYEIFHFKIGIFVKIYVPSYQICDNKTT